MKITVNREPFVKELGVVAAATERRTTIPILGNVLLEANEGVLTLTCSDLQSTIVSHMKCDVVEPGSITIPAKRLLDYVRGLTHDELSLSVGENDWVNLRSGKSKSRMAGIAPGAFPETPKLTNPKAVSIETEDLLRTINRIDHAISSVESRFVIYGALFKVSHGVLTMVATDSNILARATCAASGDGISMVLAADAMRLLPKIAAGAGKEGIVVSIDDNAVEMLTGDRVLISRRVAGNFPDYERIIPGDTPGTIVVNREEALLAVRRLAGFADERTQLLTASVRGDSISGGPLVLRGGTGTGEAEEEISATIDGPSIEFGISSKYLMRALESADGLDEEVSIYYATPKTPVVVGNGNSICVISLMHIDAAAKQDAA